MSATDIKYPENFELYPAIEDQQKAVNRNETTESIRIENNRKAEVELEDKISCHGWLKGSPRL